MLHPPLHDAGLLVLQIVCVMAAMSLALHGAAKQPLLASHCPALRDLKPACCRCLLDTC